jgi:hypothetical protein
MKGIEARKGVAEQDAGTTWPYYFLVRKSDYLDGQHMEEGPKRERRG